MLALVYNSRYSVWGGQPRGQTAVSHFYIPHICQVRSYAASFNVLFLCPCRQKLTLDTPTRAVDSRLGAIRPSYTPTFFLPEVFTNRLLTASIAPKAQAKVENFTSVAGGRKHGTPCRKTPALLVLTSYCTFVY